MDNLGKIVTMNYNSRTKPGNLEKRNRMTIEQSQERLPPYVSYKTWSKLLDGLVTFLPDVIDSSYYAGLLFSGSSAKKLRTALRFLGLINNSSVPTEQLQRLVRASRGEGQEIKATVLRDVLQNAYPTLFTEDFNLKRVTLGQLAVRFEELGAKGNIQRHCISFFLHLAADAELELSPHLAGRSRLGIGRKSIVLKSRERRRKATLAGTLEGVQVGKGEGLNLPELDPALVVLLKRLPKSGTVWEAGEKTKFKKAFEAILDVVYPDQSGGR